MKKQVPQFIVRNVLVDIDNTLTDTSEGTPDQFMTVLVRMVSQKKGVSEQAAYHIIQGH